MGNNDKIDNIIDNLRKLYQQEYGVAVFDIETKETKKSIELKGEVLTKSQRDDIIDVLKGNKENIIKDDIKVLADASERNEIGWAIVKNKIIDLKLRFVSNKIINEKILKRIRCSQAFQDEILKVLYKNEDQLLVQQNDLTLGWVNRSEVIMKRKSLYKKWVSGSFALKNKIIFAKKPHNINRIIKPTSLIVKEAEKYLGVKYVLGGRSKESIDCSGLIQVAYKNSLNIILPKHSWDQKEIGKKVRLEDVKTGDLVFLIKKSNKHKHVGIVKVAPEKNAKRLHISTPQAFLPEKTGHSKRGIGTMEPIVKNINLIHASLDKRKVVKQGLDKVFKKYDFVEARRIIK